MKKSALPTLARPPCGGRGDGSAAIRLGIVTELVVDLARPDSVPLYRECLVRMLVAETVVMTAGGFIDDVEAAGDIGLLDTAIVGVVLDALEDEPCEMLGCNISPKTLADPIQWEGILSCIGRRRHLAHRLILEITESSPIEKIPDAGRRLAAVQRLGCRIAIDDFGAGYALASRLNQVDIHWDIIKIDRRFCAEVRKTPSGRDGLYLNVNLAGCFASTIVVEGIESDEHLATAQAAGATHGQGFRFVGPCLERWTELDTPIGHRLAAALVGHGAVIRSLVGCPDEDGARPTLVLSRVDRLGDRVRALIARAGIGGGA